MKYFFVLILIILAGCMTALKKNEAFYQKKWCADHGGRMEVRTPNGTRCDCVTSEYAIEFDFAPKWLEAVGQSLNYAFTLKKKPGIVLICRSELDRKKFRELKRFSREYLGPRGLFIRVWGIDCQ